METLLLESALLNRVRAALPQRPAGSEAAAATPGRASEAAPEDGTEENEEERADG